MEPKEYISQMVELLTPSLDELLLESGHVVVIEKYEYKGGRQMAQNWHFPNNLVSFVLVPAKGPAQNVAHILVMDPQRVEYKRVEIQNDERDSENAIREQMKAEGFDIVLTQFAKSFKEGKYHLIGVKPRISQTIT